jgi:hypothetical protein
MKSVACPYCGSKAVNGVDLDAHLYPVVINDDGTSWRAGDWEDSADGGIPFTLFFCNGCQSEYVPPVGASGEHDDTLSLGCPEVLAVETVESLRAMAGGGQEPIRKRVAWLPIEKDLLGDVRHAIWALQSNFPPEQRAELLARIDHLMR